MDPVRFDDLSRVLAAASSRRLAARALGSLALGGALGFAAWEGAGAKSCGPCRKKKKGKCKKKRPNGTPCGGVCNECVGGGCGNKPNDTACDGNGRCLTGTCNQPPTCKPAFFIACFNEAECCSGFCNGVFPNSQCGKGGAGTQCFGAGDCTSGICSGFRCQ